MAIAKRTPIEVATAKVDRAVSGMVTAKARLADARANLKAVKEKARAKAKADKERAKAAKAAKAKQPTKRRKK